MAKGISTGRIFSRSRNTDWSMASGHKREKNKLEDILFANPPPLIKHMEGTLKIPLLLTQYLSIRFAWTYYQLFKPTWQKDPWDNDCLICSAQDKCKLIFKTQHSRASIALLKTWTFSGIKWVTMLFSEVSPFWMASILMFPRHCVTPGISIHLTNL